MKQNPYLTGLLTAAVLLLVFGALAFVIGLVSTGQPIGVVAGIGAFLFPLGALALLLWLHACAIVWRPSDEPAPR